MDGSPAIGHNNPPDPIEVVCAEFDATISEAQNWADGEPVENESQMKAVDAIIKDFKKYNTALKKAGEERTRPLHSAWKAEVAAVKIYLDDAVLMQKALVDLVAPFKAKILRERQEAERRAWQKAEAARRDAEAKSAAAAAGNIEQQREAHAAQIASIEAQKAAKSATAEKPKGMRTVHKNEITDHRAALHWIAQNDKDAMTAFIEEYVRRNFKSAGIDGVRVWTEKEAF